MRQPIARGRDADVFALGRGRVLRRYRDGGDVAAEAEVMTHLASHGYPVPRVFAADGPDLVLERLTGPTLLAATLADRVTAADAGRRLADLHDRLGLVPARGEQPVLHLDLHPDNVVLAPRGPVVIDWRTAGEGPPALDVAVTAVTLAQTAVADDSALGRLAGALLAPFLAAAAVDPSSQVDRAVARRAADPNRTAAEVGALVGAGELVRRTVERVR